MQIIGDPEIVKKFLANPDYVVNPEISKQVGWIVRNQLMVQRHANLHRLSVISIRYEVHEDVPQLKEFILGHE